MKKKSEGAGGVRVSSQQLKNWWWFAVVAATASFGGHFRGFLKWGPLSW
jgi:hypothetical protein